MLVHRRVTPQQYVASTHLYTWVERDNVEYKVSCLRKQHDGRDWALNHQPSDLKSDTLTTTPLRPHDNLYQELFRVLCTFECLLIDPPLKQTLDQHPSHVQTPHLQPPMSRYLSPVDTFKNAVLLKGTVTLSDLFLQLVLQFCCDTSCRKNCVS